MAALERGWVIPQGRACRAHGLSRPAASGGARAGSGVRAALSPRLVSRRLIAVSQESYGQYPAAPQLASRARCHKVTLCKLSRNRENWNCLRRHFLAYHPAIGRWPLTRRVRLITIRFLSEGALLQQCIEICQWPSARRLHLLRWLYAVVHHPLAHRLATILLAVAFERVSGLTYPTRPGGSVHIAATARLQLNAAHHPVLRGRPRPRVRSRRCSSCSGSRWCCPSSSRR